jgi:hypothetical protein
MSSKRILPFSTPSDQNIVITRGFIRSGAIQDEEWIEGDPVPEPQAFIRDLRGKPPADIFTFARPVPHSEPCYPFHFEWDNAAGERGVA